MVHGTCTYMRAIFVANFVRGYLCNGCELEADTLKLKRGDPKLSIDRVNGDVPLALGQRHGGKPPWTPQLVTPSPLHLCSLVQLAHAPHALANRVYSYAYFLHKTRGRHTHYSSRESTFETQS